MLGPHITWANIKVLRTPSVQFVDFLLRPLRAFSAVVIGLGVDFAWQGVFMDAIKEEAR